MLPKIVHLFKTLSVGTLILGVLFMMSCSDDTATGPAVNPGQIHTVKSLDAHTGQRGKAGEFPTDYTFYSLVKNKKIDESKSNSTKWDIAFSGRGIVVNGGNYGPGNGGILVLDVPFKKVTEAPTTGFNQTTLDWQEWANYTGRDVPKHAFLPKDNTTIVVKTANGNHYVKIKIISWYKGNPNINSSDFKDWENRVPGGYFTFKYKTLK